MPAETRRYNYDEIGNRNSSEESEAGESDYVATSYLPNELNQYLSVTTNGVAQARSHDDDGNMLTDGKWDYKWNANNRLIEVADASVLKTNGAVRVRNTYDYMGRRVKKIVDGWDSGLGVFVPQETLTFVYDGWLLVQELSDQAPEAVAGTPGRNLEFFWGLDGHNSIQALGGIGNLICQVEVGSSVKWFCYDAEGNPEQSVASNDFHAIRFSPFGEMLDAVVSFASPFSFSSKYTDELVGLVYFGLRFYSIPGQRWLQRDPIGELGGQNMYVLVGNARPNYHDVFGLGPRGFFKPKPIKPKPEEWKPKPANSPYGTLTPTDKLDIIRHKVDTLNYEIPLVQGRVGLRRPVNCHRAGEAVGPEALSPRIVKKHNLYRGKIYKIDDKDVKFSEISYSKEGFPIFDDFALSFGKTSKYTVPGMKGDVAHDGKLLIEALKKDGVDPKIVDKIQEALDGNEFILHHVEGGKQVQLVHVQIHDSFKHTGGSAPLAAVAAVGVFTAGCFYFFPNLSTEGPSLHAAAGDTVNNLGVVPQAAAFAGTVVIPAIIEGGSVIVNEAREDPENPVQFHIHKPGYSHLNREELSHLLYMAKP